ncbi:MAG: DnaJ domain-containing protein [Bacteroidaceae bacterium]|nr:DnaJ domain-containing protein [Bacteroidaceae bacterium]
MAGKKELYAILEIEETASDAQIQSAYERLIKENPEGSPLYSRIVEAYTILSDMDSRAIYDVTGKVSKGGKRRRRSANSDNREKTRYALNTLFLAGAAITTILFILLWSGAIGTTPFYVACGISLLIKIAEYILRLVP